MLSVASLILRLNEKIKIFETEKITLTSLKCILMTCELKRNYSMPHTKHIWRCVNACVQLNRFIKKISLSTPQKDSHSEMQCDKCVHAHSESEELEIFTYFKHKLT